jgi:hypothetical protein
LVAYLKGCGSDAIRNWSKWRGAGRLNFRPKFILFSGLEQLQVESGFISHDL